MVYSLGGLFSLSRAIVSTIQVVVLHAGHRGGFLSAVISHLEANMTKAKFLRFVKSGMIFNKISKYVTKNYEDDNTFFQRRFIMATQASYWILRNESLGNATFALDQIFTETAKAVGGASYEETKLAFLNVHIKDVYGMARGAAADEYSFVPYESEYT